MYDPSSTDKKEIWLQIAKHRPKQPLDANIYLKLIFHMPRPKYHFKTKAGKPTDIVKDKYNEIKLHGCKPDLDNLVKAALDGISGETMAILDDKQIVEICAFKRYGDRACLMIDVFEIGEIEDEDEDEKPLDRFIARWRSWQHEDIPMAPV